MISSGINPDCRRDPQARSALHDVIFTHGNQLTHTQTLFSSGLQIVSLQCNITHPSVYDAKLLCANISHALWSNLYSDSYCLERD